MDIVSIVLQALLAAAFFMSGLTKISGMKMQVDSFNHLKLPQWFRVVTGLVQWVGVTALIIGFWEPSWAAAGGLWLGAMMIGATLAHARVKDPVKLMFPAIILTLLSLAAFFLRMSELSEFPGF
ncbi:DoxX family protein [Cohnella luojiensis]|uniref:DoxX family protein n=1 Tax=Cohnella luojiensis TaxID=652876 RepID=A0A4Y8LT50_9BACL|nr:DoxX family protein [Cohnella luojiensis]TFE24547.1 DoxX family protein [Cohnella luojiensis]